MTGPRPRCLSPACGQARTSWARGDGTEVARSSDSRRPRRGLSRCGGGVGSHSCRNCPCSVIAASRSCTSWVRSPNSRVERVLEGCGDATQGRGEEPLTECLERVDDLVDQVLREPRDRAVAAEGPGREGERGALRGVGGRDPLAFRRGRGRSSKDGGQHAAHPWAPRLLHRRQRGRRQPGEAKRSAPGRWPPAGHLGGRSCGAPSWPCARLTPLVARRRQRRAVATAARASPRPPDCRPERCGDLSCRTQRGRAYGSKVR